MKRICTFLRLTGHPSTDITRSQDLSLSDAHPFVCKSFNAYSTVAMSQCHSGLAHHCKSRHTRHTQIFPQTHNRHINAQSVQMLFVVSSTPSSAHDAEQASTGKNTVRPSPVGSSAFHRSMVPMMPPYWVVPFSVGYRSACMSRTCLCTACKHDA